MFRTLYARLSLALIGLFLVTGLLYTLITTATTERHLQEITQHFNRDLAARIVADRGLVIDGEMDDKALKKTFSVYMDINPSIEIYLLDKEGTILAFSADPGKVKRKRVDLQPIQAFMDGEGFPLLGDDPRSHERRKAFSVTPVPAGDMPAGYLYVVLRGEEYDNAEQAVEESYVLRYSASAVAVSLGFGLLTGLLLFHWLTRRVQRLSQVMSSFQQSDFTRHEPFRKIESGPGGDEVDRLGAAFDEMAARIIDQWGQLKEQDRLRRELVAQVSHDLRTPLAALHGYLETVNMKGEELKEERREEYLAIALNQSERLKGMVEELFELAQLEARDTQPVCEPMPLAELVQDVFHKFQLRAHESGISLGWRVSGHQPYVNADFALTERVLDNLIVNALDHVEKGGTVSLMISEREREAVVSITDSGGGISEDDLPHIFEPFYKKRQAGKDGDHAGLGLAIARRMVELQGGTITATNSESGGACFSFTLPLVQND
ncbi:MAG: HAMP domain-containing histidine kinase [Candidatus Thiodiazotropha sp. (ex Ctena orbiculata)]|nr:HAMP domain-containing histidine kinase [Candidatus Thiodiazotropha taylori]MBT2996920.1 HAMP domain-containing histidine kinase [Candidatus Thiodiazotropha taylori]MBT3000775.1 HAMP domain-containing histidine kinase [Candidatus Thiodiazotropha taylori]MBV2107870.1 HAMP domain-containing histidine kinase [Candidatus Thiodiazotropha taylori]MBV2110631.1 HAMP domain-containing histidine kinase [Candidatus Thiodiazotropha taylori]